MNFEIHRLNFICMHILGSFEFGRYSQNIAEVKEGGKLAYFELLFIRNITEYSSVFISFKTTVRILLYMVVS